MSVFKDQRGAMLVMGIPLLFLLIGMLFYLLALSGTLVARERMQDAADSTALTGAIMHARGMNLVAVTNQLMAALVAVLIVVRLFQFLMGAAVVLGAVLAVPTKGASTAVVAPALKAEQTAGRIYDSLRAEIPPLLRMLHVFELGVKYGMPAAAQAQAQAATRTYFGPPAVAALVIPGRYPMPIEAGSWSELCAKAGEYVGQVISSPVDSAIGKCSGACRVGDIIKGLLDPTTRAFAAVYCAGGPVEKPLSVGKATIPWPSDGFPRKTAANDCGGGQMVHHRMQPGLVLGAEPFQVRSLVLAGDAESWAARIVEKVPFRRPGDADSPPDPWAGQSALARTASAQAEYYFDSEFNDGKVATDPAQWHWEPSWRARLRRLRAPARGATSAAEAPGCGFDTLQSNYAEACSLAGNVQPGTCPNLQFLQGLDDLVVH